MEEKQETTMQSERKRNPLLIPFGIALIGSLMLIATLFLPFASATDEYQEYLQKYSEEMYLDAFDMTNGDAVELSLFEFGRIYAFAAQTGISEEIAIACLVIIAAFAFFAALTALFAALKKPIAVLIFNLLSLGVFRLIKFDFEDRGVLPSSSYDWGFAEIVCYIGCAVVIVGAALLLAGKIKMKRQRKALANA